MCDVHRPLTGVAMVRPDPLVAWRPAPDRKPGFMTLSEEEFRAEVRQEPIEKYYSVQQTAISTGQWASVYKCQELSSGQHFAAKFCSKRRMGVDSSREILHEVAAMYHARDCPKVVRLHQVFETQHQFILVMELGSGGDLQAVLDNDQVPYEPDVVRFITNLLEGLAFLHDRNIAHLDIKPQNLVLTGAFPDCDIKLCDLEISRVISAGQEIREMLGTPDYVSPEILRFEPVTLAADMWSVGVLAYVLLTGFTPFGGDSDAETFRNIARAELEFPDELFEDVSASGKDFIRRCLAKEPRDRFTASEAMTHRWLTPLSTPVSPPILSPSESFASSENLLSAGYSSGSLRRSISKSREVLSVKVSRSNLKKNISKSRERLSDMNWTVPMRPDQFPLCLRASTSDVPSSRPPWKGTGCRGPVPSASTTAMERINTFKIRDEYQCQVAAGLATSCQSLEGGLHAAPSSFVRHGSLRGRRKTSTPNGSSTDIRSSLRRTRHTESAMNLRNSCQEDVRTLPDAVKKKDGPKRTHSASDAILHSEKGTSPTNGSLLSVKEDKPDKEGAVETFSDDDDVFTRLYKDVRKDVEPKSRLMSTKYLEHNDEEKENLISAKASTLPEDKSCVDALSPAFPRRQRSPISRAHKATSEQTGKLPNKTTSLHTDDSLDTTMPGHEGKLDIAHVESSNVSVPLKHHEPCKSGSDAGTSKPPAMQDHIKPATPHTTGSTLSAPSSEVRRHPSPRRQLSPRRRPTPSCTHHHQSKPERRVTVDMSHPAPSAPPCVRRQTSIERPEFHHRSGACCDAAVGGEAVRLAAVLDEAVLWERTQALGPPAAHGRPSVQSSRSLATRKPRDAAEPVLDRTTPLRSSLRSTSRQVKAAAQVAPPRPGSGEEARRPPTPGSDEVGRGLRKSSTDEDMRRLSSQERTGRRGDERRLHKSSTEEDMRRLSSQERTGRRGNETHRQLRKSSTEEDVRRLSTSAPDDDGRRRFKSSSDWAGRGLRKSFTEEDVRRLIHTSARDDRRPAVAPRRRAVPFLRSTSLTSDASSEQTDTSGELYNVTAWEERAEPAGGATRATELRPVTTCRLVRRPRARTTQPAPAPTGPRLTPTSPVPSTAPSTLTFTATSPPTSPATSPATSPVTCPGSPSHDSRPAGSVFNNTVSRAVRRFQALADESKRLDTPPAVLRSPRSPRKAPSSAVQSPCVTRKCPSPALRSLSPRGRPASERASRPHGGQ